jgi:hypothetical protein
MRRTLSLLAVSTVALAALSASASPRAHAASSDLEDVRVARADSASLFNRADANVVTSDVGGHIATVVNKTAFSDATGYGEKATVSVEVTDPFGYYRGGANGAPKAILANVASEKVISGHDLGRTVQQGTNVTLTEVAKGTYRGTTTVQASLEQGDDQGVNLGKVSVSFAGHNRTWNSRYGQGYTTPVTTTTAQPQ